MFNLPLRAIAKQKLSGAAASLTFTLADYSIPAGTRHLALIWNAAKTATQDMALLRFNGDTGANYNDQRLTGAVSTASAARATGATSIQLGHAPTGANLFGGGMFLIPHYANTANHKAVLAIGGEVENRIDTIAGRWADASAITSVTILTSSSTFVANSIFWLCVVDERYAVASAEQNLSADGTVTFSSIPQLDGDLVVVGYCRTDRVAISDGVLMSVNGDTTEANYVNQALRGSGATTSAAAASTRELGTVPSDSATANAFGAFVVSISQHANGVKQPHFLAMMGYHESSGPNAVVATISGRRANIAAYTSLAFTPSVGTNFKSGSLFSLYFVPKRLVAYTKLAVDSPSITHTVPAGYEAIFPTVFARDDKAAFQSGVRRSFNNDVTDANYDYQFLGGVSTTVQASQSTGGRFAAELPGASTAANIFGGGIDLIPAPSETDRHKHSLGISGNVSDSVGNRRVSLFSRRWESTTAIAEIDLTPNGTNFEGD